MARFGIVGGAATIVTLAVAEGLLLLVKMPGWLALALAFPPGFVVSYLGHRHFTFGHGGRDSLVKFFLVSVSGILVGEACLHLLGAAGALHPALKLLISVVAIPLTTYTAARLWAFRKPD